MRGVKLSFLKWCHEPESIFFHLFFYVPLTRRAAFRQCLPTYLTEWQWLSALLFSPYSHFPVCRWIPTPRHCFGGRPETGLHSTVLMLQLGWGTVLMFLIKFCHSIELFYAQLMPIYIHPNFSGSFKRPQNVFVLMKNVLMKPPWVVLKQNIYQLHSKCVDLNITARFTEFPGERESVTCWREPQSDKWRLPLFFFHGCSPMCDCLNMWLKWRGGQNKYKSKLLHNYKYRNSHRDSKRSYNHPSLWSHSDSSHATSNKVTIHWSSGKAGKKAYGICHLCQNKSSLCIHFQKPFKWTISNIKDSNFRARLHFSLVFHSVFLVSLFPSEET